jgi:hypothetical protein
VQYLENRSVPDQWRMSLVDCFALVCYCTVIYTASHWDVMSVHQACSGEALWEVTGEVSSQETFTQTQRADRNPEKVQHISVLLESQ